MNERLPRFRDCNTLIDYKNMMTDCGYNIAMVVSETSKSIGLDLGCIDGVDGPERYLIVQDIEYGRYNIGDVIAFPIGELPDSNNTRIAIDRELVAKTDVRGVFYINAAERYSRGLPRLPKTK